MAVMKAVSIEEVPGSEKFTWKEFKEMCEQRGISDDDIIDDINISWGKREFFQCEWDEVYGWKISLVST